MSTLAPFKIFQIYHGCFLHYTTNYDYQKYQGKTSYTEETFNRRSDKYSFHNLSRQFEKQEMFNAEFLEYYLAWEFYQRDKWVTVKNIIEDQARFQLEWLNYSNQHLNNFALDMVKIRFLSGEEIFEKLQYGDVHYQTLLTLNKYNNIIDLMNQDLAGRPLWDFKYNKLKKFIPFYEEHEPTNEMMYRTYIN